MLTTALLPAAAQQPSSTVSVVVGATAELECGVGGAGGVAWTKDGQNMTLSPPDVWLFRVSHMRGVWGCM